MPRRRSVALLCDAGPAVGLGHLSRCVSLAEAIEESEATAWVLGSVSPDFRFLLDDAGVRHVEAGSPLGAPGALDRRLASLAEVGADVVVVDSYEAGVDVLARLAAGWPVCAVDDFAELDRYPCDAVLNFTVGADASAYPPGPTLLLGPSWFLARRSVRALRASTPVAPAGPVRRVLVAIGGEDRHGLSVQVAGALVDVDPGLVVDVVLGRAGGHVSRIDEVLAGAAPGSSVRVGVPSMAECLRDAGAVVAGGGLTKYEAAFVGRPTAVLDQTDEQAGETGRFVAAGLAVGLGGPSPDPAALRAGLAAFLGDQDLRARLARRCRDVFPPDPTGAAAERIVGLARD